MALQFPVDAQCEALEVSRSGYYCNRKAARSPRRLRDEELKPLIRSAFERGRGSYGAPRIYAELKDNHVTCSVRRVARLMREMGLAAKTRRKWRPVTTQSDPSLAASPNWLAKVPAPCAPNQIWVSDITYLPTREGWHYLAVIMDLYSRRIVGWSTSRSLETPIVAKALERAVALRDKAPGLIHHSDRGSQYASHYYRQELAQAGFTSSMSRKGNCYDNAFMESFFASLKTEVFDDKVAATRREAELLVFDYIETFYNPRRRHTSLGFKSPLEFEAQHMNRKLHNDPAIAVSAL
jgi:transposase InsO family protein